MKKIKNLVLIFIFSFLFLPLNIFAANTKLIISTTFANNIDLEEVGTIYVSLGPKELYGKEFVLKYDKDFKYEEVLNVDDVTVTNVFVDKDYNGKYDYTYNKVHVADGEIEVQINMFLAKKTEKKTSAVINESIYGDIFGEDYVNRITEAIDSPHGVDDDYVDPGANKTTTGSGNGNGTGTTSSSPTGTTEDGTKVTTTNEYGQTDKDLEEQSKRIEEEEKEIKRQEEQKKRNKLYTYILIAFIGIIIIAIIVVMIKIAKANK